MNELIQTQLKIIVERSVRPVRASMRRKRNMRQELLAHVVDVFEEEAARVGDETDALRRTSGRFGNPAEVTAQLQESVPRTDGFWACLEGRPDEPILRGALRFVAIETAIAWAALAAAFVLGQWSSTWSRAELISVIGSFGFLPFWLLMPLGLLGVALMTHFLEPTLQGSEPLAGWPRIGFKKMLASAWAVPPVRTAVLVGVGCTVALACTGGFRWPMEAGEWNLAISLRGLLFVGAVGAAAVVGAWFLVQTVAERRRRHQEWSLLPLAALEE